MLVFVDGDFWHGRNWDDRKKKLARGSNAAYWLAKIEGNMERDKEVSDKLRSQGWVVIRVWEGDIRTNLDPIADDIARRVRASLAATIER